jgi:PHP family Zn ribbon phosphoesterase
MKDHKHQKPANNESQSVKNSIRCDLHIHSALSPCSDDDMTPGNIVGMAMLNGLDVIAVTDHQSCGNCAAAMQISAEMSGPLVVPGMEAASSEEIHLLCLFSTLAKACEFEKIIRDSIIPRENRPDIFGHQYYYDKDDLITGEEKQLLLMPAMLSCDEIAAIVFEMGGACLPAHVDREANSMLETLGSIPDTFPGSWIELSNKSDPVIWHDNHPDLREKRFLVNSDAHRLEDIADPGWPLRLPDFTSDERGLELLLKRLREE